MTALRTAAKQALEALEQDNPAGRTATITALRAALAQEPQTTHSAECWRWHHKCAVAKIERECKHD